MTEGPAETSPRDGYLPLTELARYSGLSVRTLRGYITAKRNPLPHYRPGAKVVVRRSEFDAWMHAFRSRANGEDQTQRIDRLIDQILWREAAKARRARFDSLNRPRGIET